jgi:hypothetical protein
MVDVGRLKRSFRKMCPKNKCFIATKGCDMNWFDKACRPIA